MLIEGLKMYTRSKTLRCCSSMRLISATVLPLFDGPRKMPVHGTFGTTGSLGCFEVYSGVGKSLILPMAVFTCWRCCPAAPEPSRAGSSTRARGSSARTSRAGGGGRRGGSEPLQKASRWGYRRAGCARTCFSQRCRRLSRVVDCWLRALRRGS